MKVALSNFGASNTPVSVEKIGNLLLKLAILGTAIVGLPMIVPAIVLPAAVLTAANWMIAGGVIGKSITKLFGVTTPDEISELSSKTNAQIVKQVDTADKANIENK